MHYLVCFTYGLFRTSKGSKDSRILKLTAEEAISLPAIKKAVVNELLEYYKHSTAFESFRYELHCESITAITPITTPAPQENIRTIEFEGHIIPVNRIVYIKKYVDATVNFPAILIVLDTDATISKSYSDGTALYTPSVEMRNLAFDELHRKYTTGKP